MYSTWKFKLSMDMYKTTWSWYTSVWHVDPNMLMLHTSSYSSISYYSISYYSIYRFQAQVTHPAHVRILSACPLLWTKQQLHSCADAGVSAVAWAERLQQGRVSAGEHILAVPSRSRQRHIPAWCTWWSKIWLLRKVYFCSCRQQGSVWLLV